jgi:hypothetical protein
VDVAHNGIAQKLKQRQPACQQYQEKSLVRQTMPAPDQIGLELVEDSDCCLVIHERADSILLDAEELRLAQTKLGARGREGSITHRNRHHFFAVISS